MGLVFVRFCRGKAAPQREGVVRRQRPLVGFPTDTRTHTHTHTRHTTHPTLRRPMYVLTERLMTVHAYNYTFVCTVPTGFGPGIADWGVLEFFSLYCSFDVRCSIFDWHVRGWAFCT